VGSISNPRLNFKAWLSLTFIAALFLSAMPASAQEFPFLSGRVVDQAEILTAEQEAELSEKLEAVEEATTRQLVIATVNSLQGLTIEDYGYQLGRQWEIGQSESASDPDAEKDNGVLLIVAPIERKVRIEVGYGLEGVITDTISSRIIRANILPEFRAGDLPSGIFAGTETLTALLLLGQVSEQSEDTETIPALPPPEIQALYEDEYDLLWEIELAIEPYIPMLGGMFVLTLFLVTIISLIGAITGRREIMLWSRLEEAAWQYLGGDEGAAAAMNGSSYRSGSFSSGFSGGGFSGGSFSGGSSFSGGGGSFGGGGASGGW